MSFIRPKTFEYRSFQSRHERFAGRALRRAGRSGIFYGSMRERRSLFPLCGGYFALFRCDISRGNIPKYFQISCDYFCL